MARRPAVFSKPTTLYHPVEGSRVFPAGEQDPGPSWYDRPGGEPIGESTLAQAMKDLTAAHDRMEALEGQLTRNAHDVAVMQKERDEALAKVHGLEQALLETRKELAELAQIGMELTKERDEARAAAAKAASFNGAPPAAFDHDGDGAPGGSAPSEPMTADAIPADWRSRHWKQKVKLAGEIAGRDIDGTEDAEAVIAEAFEAQEAAKA